jgi:hypothetical protein
MSVAHAVRRQRATRRPPRLAHEKHTHHRDQEQIQWEDSSLYAQRRDKAEVQWAGISDLYVNLKADYGTLRAYLRALVLQLLVSRSGGRGLLLWRATRTTLHARPSAVDKP